jgi:hypothetical protein
MCGVVSLVRQGEKSRGRLPRLRGASAPAAALRAMSFALVAGMFLLASASAAQATWIGIYAFEKNGNPYDVVTAASGDSLDDLFANGYDGLEFSSLGTIAAVLNVGTEASTAAIQDHLVRAMMELSGYGSLTNPGSIRMVYEDDSDYRYLHASYLSGVVLDEVIDYSVSVSGTLGYVVHRGSAAVPEPSTAWLLTLGIAGLGMRRRVR